MNQYRVIRYEKGVIVSFDTGIEETRLPKVVEKLKKEGHDVYVKPTPDEFAKMILDRAAQNYPDACCNRMEDEYRFYKSKTVENYAACHKIGFQGMLNIQLIPANVAEFYGIQRELKWKQLK